MLRRYSTNFELFSILVDAISIVLSLFLVANTTQLLENTLLFIKHSNANDIQVINYIFFPAIWVIINLLLNLYDGRSNVRIVDEMSRLMLSIFLATIGLAGIYFYFSPEYSPSLHLVFILIATFLMVVWRLFVRLYWRLQYLKELELRRVLIVGAGETGQHVATSFSNLPDSNLRIIGFLDDAPEKFAQNQKILGTTSDIEAIISRHHINIVIIALPYQAFDLSSNIVYRLRMMPVKVWIVPNAHRLSLYRSKVEYLSDIPLVDIRAPSISEKQRLVKRIFDLILSFMILIISAPLMVVIAVLIKLDSPGPILFRQKRVGENTQPFNILKFRTMVQNAEALCASVETKDEKGNILHKHRDDPRITRIGRLLRRYSLDELPQIINVLVGKMSLVGPRPELPYLVEKYNHSQYARFTIPQGVTGWWQVNGRSDKPMHLNTDADLYYIRNYSLQLDIMILWKTIKAVLKGSGAY